MRNLAVVIQQMIDVIPQNETNYINILEANKQSVLYSAPEVIPDWWRIVANNIGMIVGPEIDKEWKDQVVKIWLDKIS